MTNSLCIHYVAHHRSSVPHDQLQIIETFEWGEADPSEDELLGPDTIAKSTLEMVVRSLGQGALRTWCELGLDLDSLCVLLRSVDSIKREGAEALFSFLLNMKSHVLALSTALERQNLNAAQWGANAVRLPDWDRDAWLAPMLELLKAEYVDKREPRRIAYQFRYLRTTTTSIPQELMHLSQAAEGELKAAATLAIRQLAGD
jgi:hypothetical protein